MSLYPSETNASAQQQCKEVKVPPLWTLGLIKKRTWQGPAENGEIFPGYHETGITAGGINGKGMQKIQEIFGSCGYKWGKPWEQRPSRVFGCQPHFWFILLSLTSSLKYTEIPFPLLKEVLFCFVFHITLQESKDGARAVTTTASTGSVPDWGKQEFRSMVSKASD